MNKISKKLLFLSVIIVLSLFRSSAQDNPIGKISISSPTAAALGKYGDIPVNYHTGIPQISIPIYKAKAGSLSLPIGLSYHAAGLKVQEPASWTGAGWSLDAGGVITRTVMGAPDERGTNNAGTEMSGHFSDYGYNNYAYYGGSPDWLNFARGYKDGEPDLYFFNFSGYSGKFYFRDDRTPVIVPEADIRIVPLYNETGNASIQGFIITTPDGVQYAFGNTPGMVSTVAPVEITKPVTAANGLSTANTISSWYLNKISTADNQFNIDLRYEAENYGFHTISIFPIDPILSTEYVQLFGSTHGYELIKNIVQGVRVSQIIFPNGVVNFIGGANARTDLSDNTPSLLADIVNTSAKPLGSIEISDGTTVLKKFNFSYSYFTDNSTQLPVDIQNFGGNFQTDKQRLKLDYVQEVSGDGAITNPPYMFNYFTEQVPRRLSFAFDHWGFINGAAGNQSPIPAYMQMASNNTTQFEGANRESSWPAMRGGTLKQIIYPTGGNTTFDFDYNTTIVNTTSINHATLANLTAYMFGNGNPAPQSFTSNGSVLDLELKNTSSYNCFVVISNASNPNVYSTTINGNTTSLPPVSVTLPQGTYTLTMSFSPYTPTDGGAQVIIRQYQSVQVTGQAIVGGNRIKTITTSDGTTDPAKNIVTSYSYFQDDGQSSSAILYSRPVYVGIVRNDFIRDVGYWTANNQISPTGMPLGQFVPSGSPSGCSSIMDAYYFKSGGSIRPMASSQGYHLGYSQVKVSQSGNGYSIYKYYGSTGVPSWLQNVGDVSVRIVDTRGCDGNAPNYPYPPLPFDYMRGELQYEAHYNEAGQVLKEVTYTPHYTTNPITTPAFMVTFHRQQLMATKYELSTAKKTQMDVAETIYGQGGGHVTNSTTTYFESPYHHQATRSLNTNSKNEAIETKQKYGFDFSVPACDAIADGFTQYNTNCNTCTATYNSARLACGNSCANNNDPSCPGVCLTNAYISYLQCLTTARVNYVNYRKTNFSNSGNTFFTAHLNAKNAADAELKPVLQMQDNFENPLIESQQWRNGQFLKSSFTRYDYISNLPGQVYPNKLQAINLASPSASFTASVLSGNTISKDNRYTDESVLKYYNGNIAQVTTRDGVVTAYIFGYNNVFPVVKATNIDFNTLKSAYDAVNGNLNSIRTQPSLSKAFINTYEYNPLAGMTKEYDMNNRATYYEYDSLYRLKLIRDQDGNIIKTFQYKYAAQP